MKNRLKKDNYELDLAKELVADFKKDAPSKRQFESENIEIGEKPTKDKG